MLVRFFFIFDEMYCFWTKTFNLDNRSLLILKISNARFFTSQTFCHCHALLTSTRPLAWLRAWIEENSAKTKRLLLLRESQYHPYEQKENYILWRDFGTPKLTAMTHFAREDTIIIQERSMITSICSQKDASMKIPPIPIKTPDGSSLTNGWGENQLQI